MSDDPVAPPPPPSRPKRTKYVGAPVEELPIDKGIPIPPADEKFRLELAIIATAFSMEKGDSILVPFSVGHQAGNMGRATGFVFIQRRDGENIRIWRVK